MRITLAQLEAFFWVAQLGSVQQAARHLNVAQPTISLRLRDLEAALNIDLFERAGRGLRPRAEALGLLARAGVVLDEIAKIREHTSQSTVSGTVRVGFAEGFAMVCLAPLLAVLRRDYPALRAELVVATSSGLERDLIDHDLDLAFLVNPIGHTGLHLLPLGLQPTAWTAAPSWNLGPKVRPADLRNVPIITNPPPSAMYRQINDWFATAGIAPAQLDICTSVTVVAHLVASGAAIGLLPLKMIEPYLTAGTINVLAATPPVEDGRVYAGFREGAQTSAIDAVIRSVNQVLASMDYLVVAGA